MLKTSYHEFFVIQSCAYSVSNAICLGWFRLKISINEFIPETYKLMNATEKVKFVNDIYKGESLSLSSPVGQSFNLY